MFDEENQFYHINKNNYKPRPHADSITASKPRPLYSSQYQTLRKRSSNKMMKNSDYPPSNECGPKKPNLMSSDISNN